MKDLNLLILMIIHLILKKLDQLKNLDDDELKDLLDEVIDRVYKVKLADGGSADDDKPKPVDPFKLMLQLNQMSDAEREQLEYMLEKLGVKKK